MKLGILLILGLTGCGTRTLRVCADPNNLPFSNDRREGFENKIVELLGRELTARVEYVWWAQRRGFVRNTLNAHTCDVVPGIATGVDLLETTAPYYRSTYVFASLKDRGLHVDSLDSPDLASLRLGVQVVGDDYANTPPVHALARRGIINVQAFRITEDYRLPNPPLRIMEAVASGAIDVALVWGPQAGYFSSLSKERIEVTPIPPAAPPDPPLQYDVSMGVRRGDSAMRAAIENAISKHRREIDAILDSYRVPRVSGGRL